MTDVVAVQPVASVIVTAYTPFAGSTILDVVAPPGVHVYTYGGVPPVTLAVAVFPVTAIVTVGTPTVMVIEATSVQVPVVPVTMYVVVVVGVTTTLAVFWFARVLSCQRYEVAPIAVRVTLVPGHTVVALAAMLTVQPTLTEAVAEQPAASLTTTVYRAGVVAGILAVTAPPGVHT